MIRFTTVYFHWW